MVFETFDFTEGNYFIGLEYYGLILNRTFLVLNTKTCLIGLKASGLLASSPGTHSLGELATGLILSNNIVKNNLENPFNYVKSSYLKQYYGQDILSSSILTLNKKNFKIDKRDITEVRYKEGKKWGMGEYPHDGRIFVTYSGKEREFVLLGKQNGKHITDRILLTNSQLLM